MNGQSNPSIFINHAFAFIIILFVYVYDIVVIEFDMIIIVNCVFILHSVLTCEDLVSLGIFLSMKVFR